MPVTLITGPHQSGKSRRLWERLRVEPVGSAILVRPTAGLPHDLIRQVHAWTGPGLLPPVWSFAELVERCAATVDLPRCLPTGLATHVLRAWAERRLRGPWSGLATFRSTGRELADLIRRLDDHGIDEAQVIATREAIRGRGDHALADALDDVIAARAALASALPDMQLAGFRLRRLADSGAAPAVATIAFDDFQTFSPAELALLRSLGSRRQVLITAVEDARLGRDAAPADRLRAALPDASVERHKALAVLSPLDVGVHDLLTTALEEGHRCTTAAAGRYRYRDPVHAGRAIAAWLRRHQIAPAQALLVVRVADDAALALADALAAAEVPVSGRFQVPLLSTTAGGRIAALAAFCRDQTWGAFLGMAERLGDAAPPVRLADLLGPWARLPVDEGLARLATLVAEGICDGWGWNEPDMRARPWLAAAHAWLMTNRERLRAEGPWWQQLAALCRTLDLGDGGSGVLRSLDEIAALHPVTADDLDELLGAARLPVERDGGAAALEITDAVRGRTWPRPVVFIHDLEHGRWPVLPVGGALLPKDERRVLAEVLGRDLYDEAGRAAGEIGALLAVVGRATRQVVFGIPCGERVPSAWLGTLCDQLGWDLAALREDAGGEAVPGAPLGPTDAQGAHERALWEQAPGQPSFTFLVPPRPPQELALKASALGAVFRDGFALVCDRLCLGTPLIDRDVMEEGSDLHALLAGLVNLWPSDWVQELQRLLPGWIDQAPDALKRIERRRRARRLCEAMSGESQVAGAAQESLAEFAGEVVLNVPRHGDLVLRGYIDRIDRLPDGCVRLVDYKRGVIGDLSRSLREGTDGQLLGYLLAAQAAGWTPSGAYYLSLRDGTRQGWGFIPSPSGGKSGIDLQYLPQHAGELVRMIAELADGVAHADPEGRSARDYAPIARLDERRLEGIDHG
jgi:hypothetical protein